MEEIVLSIIIPVYNGAAYLRACLESILCHAAPAMEVLVIDDGSTDETPALCRAVAALDPRLRLIRQPHRGVSAARNAGIREARGDYLAFVDGDDLIVGDILSLAVSCMDDHDLVCWNAMYLIGDRNHALEPMELPADPLQWVIYPPEAAGKYFRACWGKLFDRKLLQQHQIFFDEVLCIGEDGVFLLEYLKYAKRLRMLPEQGYCYRIHAGSAVRRRQPDLLSQALRQKDYIDSYAATHPDAVVCLYWDLFCKLLRNSASGNDAKLWYRAAREQLHLPHASPNHLPRLCRLQYLYGAKLPLSVLCALTRIALRFRTLHHKGEIYYDKSNR